MSPSTAFFTLREYMKNARSNGLRTRTHSSIDSASKINVDPSIFLGASGFVTESGVVSTPPTPVDFENSHKFWEDTRISRKMRTNKTTFVALLCPAEVGLPNSQATGECPFLGFVWCIDEETMADRIRWWGGRHGSDKRTKHQGQQLPSTLVMQLESDDDIRPVSRSSPLSSLNFHSEFSSPEANVVLAAKDAKVYFRVHSHTLKTTSGFFRTMYSLPQCEFFVLSQNDLP